MPQLAQLQLSPHLQDGPQLHALGAGAHLQTGVQVQGLHLQFSFIGGLHYSLLEFIGYAPVDANT